MSLEQYYMLAQIIASVAVVASLLFLAFQVKSSSKQARVANWESSIDRFNAMWSRTTSNTEFADILARGQKDLGSLSDAERIAFGHFHQELVLSYETMAMTGAHATAARRELVAVAKRHLALHFSYPGSQAWWREFSRQAGFAPQMVTLVNEAIREGSP